MRVNLENKSIDMEVRDMNYILPAYIFNYLYVSKNEDPNKIVFPMFPAVPHPRKPGVMIPIQWVPITDPLATDIAEDGKDILEATPIQEAALDAKDEADKGMKAQVEELQTPATDDRGGEVVGGSQLCSRCGKPIEEGISSNVCGTCADDLRQYAIKAATESIKEDEHEVKISPAKAALGRSQMDRAPKMPEGGDIGPGTRPDNMGSRDIKLNRQIVGDLKDEPDVDEGAEKPTEVEKPKE